MQPPLAATGSIRRVEFENSLYSSGIAGRTLVDRVYMERAGASICDTRCYKRAGPVGRRSASGMVRTRCGTPCTDKNRPLRQFSLRGVKTGAFRTTAGDLAYARTLPPKKETGEYERERSAVQPFHSSSVVAR